MAKKPTVKEVSKVVEVDIVESRRVAKIKDMFNDLIQQALDDEGAAAIGENGVSVIVENRTLLVRHKRTPVAFFEFDGSTIFTDMATSIDRVRKETIKYGVEAIRQYFGSELPVFKIS